MRQLDEMINDIADGVLPSTLDDAESTLKQLMMLSRHARPVMAVLLASAKRDHFNNDVVSWVAWASETCDIDGSDRDHLRAIGDMLLDLQDEDIKLYRRLFPIDTEKLLAVTQINLHLPDRLVDFLVAYKLESMSRQEVRAAVAECLGKTPAERAPIQPELPGFEAAVDALIQGGQQTAAALKDIVSTPEKAAGAFRVGFSMLNASVKYFTEAPEPNTAQIAAIAGRFEDAAKQLREFTASIAEKALSRGA